MKRLLNTLYITTPNSWLTRDGENVVVKVESEERFRIPFHNLESIISFSYGGASPALMSACAKNGIALSFLSENGEFLARSIGKTNGNVLVRKRQYSISDNPEEALKLSITFIAGKIFNSRKIIERHIRDYSEKTDCAELKKVSNLLNYAKSDALNTKNSQDLRGIEGNASKLYFSVLDNMILRREQEFRFAGRNRRPPKDRINAMLSFAYTLLAHDVQAALEASGLDSYVGFFHTDRPGRASLALDVMEELRAYIADRAVLSFINRGQARADDFIDNGQNGVIMKDDIRKEFLTHWQSRKQEEILHPFLGEKIKMGLIPHVQAMMLNKYMRREIDNYPVYLIQ